MHALPPALVALAAHRQFVTWFATPDTAHPGKFKKLPCHHATGAVLDTHDPAIWTDAATAINAAPLWDRGHGGGIGFVFTTADPFFFLDIDNCRTPDGWSPLAMDLCARLAGCAVEVSISGNGLHIIGRSAPFAHSMRNKANGLELYTEARFVALTGTGAMGDAAHDATAQLAPIAAHFFPQAAPAELGAGQYMNGPSADWAGPVDDAELIRIATESGARSMAAAFSGKATFGDLFAGRIDPGQQSESDQALANHLAFWTGRDAVRMDRIMRLSALVRDKWDEGRRLPDGSPTTYLGLTIHSACGHVKSVATGRKSDPAAQPAPVIATAPAGGVGSRNPGSPYMGPAEQLDRFKNCVYVESVHAIFDSERDSVMKATVFDVIYGGYLYVLDYAGQKKTDSAFEAFTMSLVNAPRTASAMCFRPELPQGALIVDGVRTYVNSYVPYNCPEAEGDPGPFLDLLTRLLPVDRDRLILLAYMASFAQNPGAKFQWWPVLQGVEGNGKTAILTVMTHIAGEHFTHLPNTAAIVRDGLKFNSWVERKLFIGMEEINVGKNRDFLQEVLTLITNRRMPGEGKGTNQITIDNRANGVFTTNDKAGMLVKKGSRRYCMLFTAQQTRDDLLRDGMGGDYFPRFWDWLEGKGRFQGQTPGLAYVAHYLKRLAIPAELDPAGLCIWAPETSSTSEAVTVSLGRAEQEVQEAIEEERPGFKGGWVSGTYLDLLFDAKRIVVPINRRRELMQALGYDWHPALKDGRANDVLTPDMKKSKLYCHKLNPAWALQTPADVARDYQKAQEPQTAAPGAQGGGQVVPFKR